jgi:hypothetical protein
MNNLSVYSKNKKIEELPHKLQCKETQFNICLGLLCGNFKDNPQLENFLKKYFSENVFHYRGRAVPKTPSLMTFLKRVKEKNAIIHDYDCEDFEYNIQMHIDQKEQSTNTIIDFKNEEAIYDIIDWCKQKFKSLKEARKKYQQKKNIDMVQYNTEYMHKIYNFLAFSVNNLCINQNLLDELNDFSKKHPKRKNQWILLDINNGVVYYNPKTGKKRFRQDGRRKKLCSLNG